MNTFRALRSANVLLILTAVVLSTLLIAAPLAGTPQETKIQKTTIKYTNPNSGQEMYAAYCAACHGATGKGDGPAAPALKTPAADLTQLYRKNGGKYPAAHVGAVLVFGFPVAAHGSADMPVWGPLFGSLTPGTAAKRAEINTRVKNLNGYLETLQAK
jgi:mono/diheme cytochrome c family protein